MYTKIQIQVIAHCRKNRAQEFARAPPHPTSPRAFHLNFFATAFFLLPFLTMLRIVLFL